MPERNLLWRRLDAPGMDHCTLRWDESGGAASGISVGVGNGRSFGVRWEVRWDANWITRQVLVTLDDRLINLEQRGEGAWYDQEGAREDLVGLWDIDLGCTPFTNTLPIRRMKLAVGASSDISVALISMPDMTVRAATQRYARLAPEVYRFEAPESGFKAILTLDSDKLVRNYEGLFARVHAA